MQIGRPFFFRSTVLPYAATPPAPLGIRFGMRRPIPCLTFCLALSACTSGVPSPAPVRGPLTRAERTKYLETSHYADVTGFLDSLRAMHAPLSFGTIGTTSEGRAIPCVIASRPLVHSAAEARATGKPIVYVQGNIHAGEVEGKEALLALVRDLTFSTSPNVLDSIILVAVPIYNADGNERFQPQARQRTEQNGPELVGQRPNAQNLDLNRDYVKAEAPETRASLAAFNDWNPDVFVDLHTTDGSFHGYQLTYSPSLNPASPLGDYSRTLLAELRNRVPPRDGYETFDYGNFNDRGAEVSNDTTHNSWYTYEHKPRYGTNYFGLRGRVSVLSEAFSHDPFETRVKSTYAFVKELLSLVAEHSTELRAQERMADAAMENPAAIDLPLRAGFPATAPKGPVRFEILARTGDTLRTQPGVPKGMRRTGEIRTRDMAIFDRFVPTLSRRLPTEYWVSNDSLVALLRLHGVKVERFAGGRVSRLEAFSIDSIGRAARPFQGHNEERFFGKLVPTQLQPSEGMYVVKTNQQLGRLAAYLLEAESDDSFATWNVLDAQVKGAGSAYPVYRVWSP